MLEIRLLSRIIFTFLNASILLCFCMINDFAIAQVTSGLSTWKWEELDDNEYLDIVKGDTIESEGRVNFAFRNGYSSYMTIKDEALPFLVIDHKVNIPSELHIEILSIFSEKCSINLLKYEFENTILAEGYSILCKVRISAGEDIKSDVYQATISFPSVLLIAKKINVDSPTYPPTCNFKITVYESEDALKIATEEKEKARKQRDEEYRREKEEKDNLFINVWNDLWRMIESSSKVGAILCLIISLVILFACIFVINRLGLKVTTAHEASSGETGLNWLIVLAFFGAVAAIMCLIRILLIWP